MSRPSEPHTRWRFEWRDNGDKFHVYDLYVDVDFRGRGRGERLILKIIKYVCRKTDAETFSIQMGGGSRSARWLRNISERNLEYFLRIEDVQGYVNNNWKNKNADRVDGEQDKEGDAQSSVYAEIDELDALRELKSWT